MADVIIYTKHAEHRMAFRKISKKDVEAVIANPDRIVPGKRTSIIQKVIKGKLLRVVYKMDNNAYIVITAYFTDKQRYQGGAKP